MLKINTRYLIMMSLLSVFFIGLIKPNSGNVTSCPFEYKTIGSEDLPSTVAFSSDGSYIAIANSGNGTISIYNVPSFTLNTTLDIGTGANPSSVSFSPVLPSGASYMSVANPAGNELLIYNVPAFTLNMKIPNLTGVNLNIFSPFAVELVGYVLIASSQTGNEAWIYEVPSFRQVLSTGVTPFLDKASSASFSPAINNGNFAAVTNAGNGTLLVGDTVTLSYDTVSLGASTAPSSASFSPNISGNYYMAVANSGTGNVFIYQYDAQTAAFPKTPTMTLSNLGAPSSLAFSPDGNYLAIADGQKSVFVYNTTSFTQITGSPFVIGSTNSDIISLAFSPNSQYMVALDHTSGITPNVYLFNLYLGISVSTPAQFCPNTNSTLYASGVKGTPPYKYSWTGPDSYSNTGSSVKVTNPGSYFVTLADALDFTCVASTSVANFPFASIAVTPTSYSGCIGTPFSLKAISVTGPQPFSYHWNGPNLSTTGPTITVSNPTIADSGLYTVDFTDGNKCVGAPISVPVTISNCVPKSNTITIINPTNNILNISGTTTITGTDNNINGQATSVNVYLNNNLLGTIPLVTSSSISTWSLDGGTYGSLDSYYNPADPTETFNLTVTDNSTSYIKASAAVTIYKPVIPTQTNTISIIEPSDNVLDSSGSTTITGTDNNLNGEATSVNVYLNNNLLATVPLTKTRSGLIWILEGGTYGNLDSYYNPADPTATFNLTVIDNSTSYITASETMTIFKKQVKPITIPPVRSSISASIVKKYCCNEIS